jgi:hypothetical protein
MTFVSLAAAFQVYAASKTVPLIVNVGRLLTVRARVTVEEPGRELFECAPFLLRFGHTVLQHMPLKIVTASHGRTRSICSSQRDNVKGA